MLVKSLGGGGGGACIDYICGKEINEQELAELEQQLGQSLGIDLEHDSREITREGARLLAGDIDLTQELINQASEKFNNGYTAGVLSFEEASISEKEKLEIMASFEKCLLPGLEPNEYNILWVEHTDKGRLELNWIVPRIHVETQAHLQPYFDAVDRPRHKAWQEMINAKYGYSSPDEPAKKQTLTESYRLPKEKAEIIKSIDGYLQEVAPKNRDEVIEAINAIDGLEVVRQAKQSISIKADGMAQNIRLKGAYYEQNFAGDRSQAERIRDSQDRFQREREQRYRASEREYQKRYSTSAERNRSKYQRIRNNIQKRAEKSQTPNNQDRSNAEMANNHAIDRVVSSERLATVATLSSPTNHHELSKSGGMALASERGRARRSNAKAREQQIKDIFSNDKHRTADISSNRSLGGRKSRIAERLRNTAEANKHTAERNRSFADRARSITKAIQGHTNRITKRFVELKQKLNKTQAHNHRANDRGGRER